MDTNDVTRDNFGMYANSAAGPGPALMGAGTLMGNDVYNKDGEDLGDIKELMIDMGTEQGITAAHRFAVTSRDEDIVHPVTGAIIKGKKNLLATYKVKAVDATTTVLVLDSKDAKEVKIGQVVEVLPTAVK